MKKAILTAMLVLMVCAAFAVAAPKVHNADGSTSNYWVHYYHTYWYHTYYTPVVYHPVYVAPVVRVYPVYTYSYWYYKFAGK